TTTMVETALKSSVINKILKADRIGSGLKPDPTHRGASYLSREQLMEGKVFTLKGGDGVERKLLQAEGSFNDKKGIYEYIYDKQGNVTHQRFIEGGNITGLPNQRPPKDK
ncbi:filamentous hemagglutinin, partial [Escherichia coli]|nr:filamentous hemagglutinin [Escherichia coli]